MKAKDFLDPSSFSVDKPQLRKRQIQNMKYMRHLIKNLQTAQTFTMTRGSAAGKQDSVNLNIFDSQSVYSMNSSARPGGAAQSQADARQTKPNPIYGYKIKSIHAKTSGTTIYRLRYDVFKEFLHPSKLKDWHEKEVESKFPSQASFENSSKKVKEHVYSNMHLRVFEPNEVLLEAGCMPKDLMFLISGKIALYQRLPDTQTQLNKPKKFVVQSVIGPRKEISILEKTYGELFMEKVVNSSEKYELLGIECDLNGIASPYTYIARERTLAFCSGAVALYRDIMRQNPEQILDLRTVARQKLQQIQNLSSTKKDALESIKKKEDEPELARKAEQEELVHKRYPNAFQSVASTITKIMELKNQTKEQQVFKNIEP